MRPNVWPVMKMSSTDSRLHVDRHRLSDDVVVLEPIGLLDSKSYLTMRDSIIKEAVGEPGLIVVRVDRLMVPAASAWAVFTSARWHISTWPDVPLAIVAADPEILQVITRNAVARYVPCYADVESAVALAHRAPVRRRASVTLSDGPASTVVGRTLIRLALESWLMHEFVPLGCIVGTHLIELVSPISGPSKLRLEAHDKKVTMAVDDPSGRTRVRGESGSGTEPHSELGILTSMCESWGSLPTPYGGRVLWAVCGSENLL